MKLVGASGMRSGATKSCGCLHSESARKQALSLKKPTMGTKRLRNIFSGMISRCYKQYAVSYERYGARGVRVCDESRADKEAFYKWAHANRYADNLELNRRDN
jgi:hypothetical protein